jgi:NTP pyrophosphohydrolases containing a Zn-finger, probably nucleic-acid-binding
MTAVNFYSGSFLDRCSELRKNFKYLQQALCKKDTKYIVFKRSRPLVESGNGKEKVLVKLSHEEVKKCFDFDLQDEEWPPYLLYLGRNAENVDWFAVNNADSEANERFNSLLNENREYVDGYIEGLLIPWNESSITAQAQSMFHWHDRYRFCPTCGSKMKIEEAGYKKTCLDTTCRSNKGLF